MSTRRVVIGGLPYFGRMLAELLSGPGWDFRYIESAGRSPPAWATTAAAIAEAGAVYLIGGQVERWSRPDWLTRLARRPIVMHWVGSDITYALDAAARGRASRRLVERAVHWAEAGWTAAELRPLGIHAAVVPLTSARLSATVHALPEEFTVLTYLPPARPEFYGRTTVYRLAARLPAIRFLVAGNGGPDAEAPPNVEFLGWVPDMQCVYARSTVLLRLPEHDGLSFMVLEALAAGRHVIWNHPLEGVVQVRSEDEALAALTNLGARQVQRTLATNDAGRRAVLKHYATERVRDELLQHFEGILRSGRTR